MKQLTLSTISAVLALLQGPTLAQAPAELTPFVERLQREQGFDADWLRNLLANAERRQDIIDLINKPAESLPWWKYRRIFLTEQRVEQGLEYWQRNRESLTQAQARYGVPPEIIVAIIGVETFYGRNTGSHRVLDALYTLGFYHPKRGSFFQGQLESMLLMSREEQVDPTTLKGSYAGAMGKPQFIPSSFRAYAVDFDGDGRKDIWNNDADAIGSVANYFARHGWQPGQGIVDPIPTVAPQLSVLAQAGMQPSHPAEALRAQGLPIAADLPPHALLSLIELEGESAPEYWAGRQNFYVITRYNHSNLYAMAVYQLSRELLQRQGASS